MHKHLTTARLEDPSKQHRLKTTSLINSSSSARNGIGADKKFQSDAAATSSSHQRQQQPAAQSQVHLARLRLNRSGTAAGPGSEADADNGTPGSLDEFYSVSPSAAIADINVQQAWQDVSRFYEPHQQQQQPYQQSSASHQQQHQKQRQQHQHQKQQHQHLRQVQSADDWSSSMQKPLHIGLSGGQLQQHAFQPHMSASAATAPPLSAPPTTAAAAAARLNVALAATCSTSPGTAPDRVLAGTKLQHQQLEQHVQQYQQHHAQPMLTQEVLHDPTQLGVHGRQHEQSMSRQQQQQRSGTEPAAELQQGALQSSMSCDEGYTFQCHKQQQATATAAVGHNLPALGKQQAEHKANRAGMEGSSNNSDGRASESAAAVVLPVSSSSGPGAGTRSKTAAAKTCKAAAGAVQAIRHELQAAAGQQSFSQEQGAGLARENSTSFAVRISGSVMAAFNGWLVNSAVSAATAAVSASAAAAFASSSSSIGHTPQQSAPGHAATAATAATTACTARKEHGIRAGESMEADRNNHCSEGAVVVGNAADGFGSAAGFWAYDSEEDADLDMLEVENAECVINDGRTSHKRALHAAAGPCHYDHQQEGAAAGNAVSMAGSSQQRRSRKRRANSNGARQASGEAGFMVVERPGVAKRARILQNLLLWHDKSATAKALGLGLYLVMLIGSIPRALNYMQLTTLLPGTALLYLGYHVAKPLLIRAYCRISGQNPAYLAAQLLAFEASTADRIIALSSRAATATGLWMLAALSLAHRALRGKRFTTTAWTVGGLWVLLLVSELRLMNQTLLAMLALCGLFTIPWLYSQFKQYLDNVVYEVVHFLMLLVVHAERWAYALAVLAFALVWQLMESEEGSLVVRGSAAGLAALTVLVWRVVMAT